MSNLFGENQPKGLFAYLLKSFRSNKILEFDNDGTLSRYFIHIKDCVEALEMALKNNLTGIYNVSSIEKLSIIELISQIEAYSKIAFDKHFNSAKPIENIRNLNCNKFMNQTGFEPKYSIQKYIQQNFKL
jgi:nucleoside-diphosphate-sugar epimerase